MKTNLAVSVYDSVCLRQILCHELQQLLHVLSTWKSVLHCVNILKRNTDPVLSVFLRSSINSRNKDVNAENVLLLGTIWFKCRTVNRC